MSHAGHERVVYSCGHVARQCRCMGPKTETKIPVACGACYIVRYFRLPGIDSQRCARCQFSYREHGWIDSGGNGRVVCPGDWVGAIAPGVNFAFSNDFVEATMRFTLDLALLNAAHAAGAIGARSDVPDNSIVMGLVLSAKNTLETARGYLDQGEG